QAHEAAAVADDGLPGDVTTGVAGEEGDHTADVLLGIADTAQRGAFLDARLQLRPLVEGVLERGRLGDRRDAVHRHTEWAPLARQALRQRALRGFHGSVHGNAATALDAGG